MNLFVNPKKRGVQLSKGCKDLADVLRASKQAKCEYCGAAAAALSVIGMEDYRWCTECQHDLNEFAAIEVKVHFRKFDSNKVHDEAAVAQYRADMQRRQDEFMRERVKERK